jgi:hypothetical protein
MTDALLKPNFEVLATTQHQAFTAPVLGAQFVLARGWIYTDIRVSAL